MIATESLWYVLWWCLIHSFLNYPTDVETDSAGDVYVFQPYNSYFEGKNYRIHVFGSDGTLKRRMLEYKYNYWNPICGKVGKSTFGFCE